MKLKNLRTSIFQHGNALEGTMFYSKALRQLHYLSTGSEEKKNIRLLKKSLREPDPLQ